ncbi:ribosomal protein L11 methyltransferase [Candidatus Tenderia electrophaga]|jgi:ribosomal protein L11 methyltransferase|uniref:Ribosomal protein L11 methyltransferase n=1 Tax=Candidatus Tenderia electrophaga TaxID=1748243 RepID=A0A0S2TAE5_9GAMM|nr:ribosomal protein L11 methyltransferase [Candidatus Tenderia electrophaga]
MPWLQLKFDSDPQRAEHISDLLSELGAAAVTFEDGADQALFEPDPGETKLWDRTRIVGLFDAADDMSAVIAALKSALGDAAPAEFQLNPVEEKDWERAWMKNFKPIRCGDTLWICPSWHTPEDPTAVNLMLDPGLAFGTGTHPTTALCLQWLDAHPPVDLECIDYGCGSGILAIAAALLGARHIAAVDHDPQAILATRDNAANNGVGAKISALLPRQFQDKPVDLVLANILANPLLELAPRFAELVKPGGRIVLSGILAAQAPQITERYSTWFDVDAPTQLEDWVRIDGRRR